MHEHTAIIIIIIVVIVTVIIIIIMLHPAGKKTLPWALPATWDLQWFASMRPGLEGLRPPTVQRRSWQSPIVCHKEWWNELARQARCCESSLPTTGIVVCDL